MMNNILELMIRRSHQATPPTPSVPTDYVFYAPLSSDLNDISQYSRTLTAIDGTPVFTTKDGIPCCRLDDWCFLETTDMSGISSGNHDFTLSLWYNPSDGALNEYGIMIAVGRDWSYQNVKLMMYGGYYAAGTWDFDNPSPVKPTSNWVNLVAKYVASTRTYSLYINGYERYSSVCSESLNMPTENGRISIGSLQGSYTAWWNDYYADAYVYNRALTDAEISALAAQHSVSYACTMESSTYIDFFPTYGEYDISYSSVNEPTFEIVSGTLPSTITFDTHTGKFYGTAPTDSDHTYNLSIRLTAPNSTPATGTVVITTYATARIWFDNQTFSIVRDGSESHEIEVSGDDSSISLAVESGYSLPSGITLSGRSLVCDGTTAVGTYSVVLRATSAHNQTGVTATMTLNVAANVISISPNPITFYVDKGAYSKPLKYTTTRHAITPVYSLSGTLPTGITFNSQTGEFSSDGLQSAASTATVSVTVASSTGLSTADTENVEIDVEMVSVVPSDYIWYTPFTTDFEEETSGIVGVPHQQNAFSIDTDNSKFGSGFLAARKTESDEYGIEYANTATYMDLSAGDISISLWLRAPNWSNYSQLLGGTRPEDGADGFVLFADFEWEGVLDFRSASNDSLKSPRVNLDSDWHHYVFTRNSSGNWAWWKDGVASTSGTGDTGSIDGNRQNMKIGGGTNWSKQAYFDLAHFRIYDRVLNSEEIEDLYGEF